jgi:hypothetical protein
MKHIQRSEKKDIPGWAQNSPQEKSFRAINESKKWVRENRTSLESNYWEKWIAVLDEKVIFYTSSSNIILMWVRSHSKYLEPHENHIYVTFIGDSKPINI